MDATTPPPDLPVSIDDELDLLARCVPLADRQILELGCGAAQLVRALLRRHPGSSVTALEVDARQHAKNLADPQPGLVFVAAGAQDIPRADASFDLVLMLKSLHHVPVPLLGRALAEAARVLRPGGHLYVSEPVYAGPFNEVVKLFNDERVVREAAQAAVDAALGTGAWAERHDHHFEMPVRFRDFAEFEQKLMRPTFADHHIDEATTEAVRTALGPHAGPDGYAFKRPMRVRLLQRTGSPNAPGG